MPCQVMGSPHSQMSLAAERPADHVGSEQKAQSRPPRKVAASYFYDVDSLKHLRPNQGQQGSARKKRQAHNPLQAPFRTFKTQAAAFEFLDQQACYSLLRTFAVETAATGQRDFIVSSAERFWPQYSTLPTEQRHHYEIIRQGSPCNLYFDLEYVPDFNPGLNGPQLVALIIAGVRELLLEQFGVNLQEDQHVLELDSSTASKFSRHLIINIPGLAFADACHAGRFVRCVLLRLLAKGSHGSKHAHLLVCNKDGGLTSFVDMGVYTRNRAFRLYLSSKFGKSAFLRLTHRFGGTSRCPEAAFHDCLVTVLPLSPQQHLSSGTDQSHSTITSLPSSTHSPKASSGNGSSGSSGSSHRLLLLCMETDGQELLQQLPQEWQQLPMLQLRPLEHVRPGQPATAAAALPAASGSTLRTPVPANAPSAAPGGSGAAADWSQPCFCPSPFPALDAFVSSVCCVGGVQGEVRSWLMQAGSCCVVYNIKGNRWCGNVGRAHKSNGIFYCVDLSAGVYYQKCYDPECRHYRSNYMPLPTDIWHAYRHMLDPSQQAQQTAAAESAAFSQQEHKQQQQQVMPADHHAAEDEECLQVLLQFEQQQHQEQCGASPQPPCHQQPSQQCSSPQQQHHHHQQSAEGLQSCAGTVVQHGGCTQHSTSTWHMAEPDACTPAADDADEDELYMQLLQEVEQRTAVQRGRPAG